ncbi:MAG: sulfatase-like hydrolase/transferase [Acidobacteria bacterium]|nr:sulfatase-like hydrolase/transferase [Acidobacteriota bacterium]
MRRVFLVLVALVATACRPSRPTPVILISIDTLRSDHLPAYGYTRIATPQLDAFRKDAILFERAYSHAPLTLPSHATLFTGRLPADNGVRDNVGFRLDAKVPTLPELLKRHGYATGAAVSAWVLRREAGLARGFDAYDDEIDVASNAMSIGRVQRHGAETIVAAKRWLATKRERPPFFFLHLYEPHSPYDPPSPFPHSYDGEVAYTDTLLGDFFAFLKAEDLYDDALIVVLSDHGEGLGDHGEDEHGIFLYRESLQVPLFVKLPGGKRGGESVAEPVQLTDVFPTILSLTKTPFERKAIAGRSLLERGARSIYSETLYPRLHYGWSELHSLIRGDDHFIQAPKPELYDVARDAAETRNRVEEDRRTVVTMRSTLLPFVREASAPANVSEEEKQKLAALGYLGSGVAASGELPDPKDRVRNSAVIRRAFSSYDRGDYGGALAACRELLAENERMVDIWDIMARALEQLGRKDEAIAAAKEGLKLSPQTTHLALMIAKMAIEKNDLTTAQQHAELAMHAEPGAAHDLLARIALARHDFDRASAEAKLALDSRERILALMTLARVEVERKNLPAALEYADRADAALRQRASTSVKGLNYLRGDILARMERNAEAERAFREEIRLFPKDAQAYKNLILLLVTEGRNDEATQLVFALEKEAPIAPSYVAISSTLRTVGDANGARYWRLRGLQQFPNDPALRRLQ